MCDVCGHGSCPSACPNAEYPKMFVCVVCGDEVFPWDTDEEFDDRRCICEDCALFGDVDEVEAAREAEYDRMNERTVRQ